jgi:hypothetical protein
VEVPYPGQFCEFSPQGPDKCDQVYQDVLTDCLRSARNYKYCVVKAFAGALACVLGNIGGGDGGSGSSGPPLPPGYSSVP